MLFGSGGQRRAPRPHVDLGGWNTYPVLEAIGGLGRDGVVLQQQ
jgi:hypothetical protein